MEADFSGSHSLTCCGCEEPRVRQWLVSSGLDQNKCADKRQLSLPLQDAGQINCEIGQISWMSKQASRAAFHCVQLNKNCAACVQLIVNNVL